MLVLMFTMFDVKIIFFAEPVPENKKQGSYSPVSELCSIQQPGTHCQGKQYNAGSYKLLNGSQGCFF